MRFTYYELATLMPVYNCDVITEEDFVDLGYEVKHLTRLIECGYVEVTTLEGKRAFRITERGAIFGAKIKELVQEIMKTPKSIQEELPRMAAQLTI